jgi:hypothetical protein
MDRYSKAILCRGSHHDSQAGREHSMHNGSAGIEHWPLNTAGRRNHFCIDRREPMVDSEVDSILHSHHKVAFDKGLTNSVLDR